MAFTLQSSIFVQGARIPTKYTADGQDVSPPLSWNGIPDGTRSFALIVDDPDAPRGVWVHWVLYNIPASARSLQEAVSLDAVLPNGAKQGTTSYEKIGYGGPNPPKGPEHRYFFKLYALDTELLLAEKATKAELENAMKGHILAEAELVGMYGR